MTAETKIKAPQVYRAIADVQGELAKVGIAKTRKNQQGSGYMYRGIDEVYSALSPLLSQHGLVVIPRVLEREVVERQSKSGGALFYVTVHAEFDFVSVADGSAHTVITYGEAMDSGDKATNKAMSAAYKYAAFMTFAIPTEGDNDADASTHEVAGRGNNFQATQAEARDAPFPQGPAKNKTELKEQGRILWADVMSCADQATLDALIISHAPLIEQLKAGLPQWWGGGMREGEPYEGLEQVIERLQRDFEGIAESGMDFRGNVLSAG